MATRLVRSSGRPSVKLLVSGVKDLPEILHPSTPAGRLVVAKNGISGVAQPML
jgi:hypothetical protein